MSKMLSSWKEIAHFFGKGVRTVQRWEKTLDLPIHRPPGAPSNVVLARTSDLEEWMHRGSVSREIQDGEATAMDSTESALKDLEFEVQALSETIGVPFNEITTHRTGDKIVAITAQVGRINERLTSPEIVRAA